MRKLRSDSKWQRIPSQAREQVIRWLFEEGMSYETALKKAEKEFGIQASLSSMARFYRHVAEERELAGLNLPPEDAEEYRAAAAKILAVVAFNSGIGCEGPVHTKRFASLMKLLLRHNQEELKRRRLGLQRPAKSRNSSSKQ